MSVNKVNSDGSLLRVAGGTLYADAPIGTIVPFGGSTVPKGYLLCDGAEVLKTTYAELYAVIGDAFGTASVSTKFVLPDLRESVPKGAGLTGKTVGTHLDADGLAVGEFIDDRIEDHNHQMDYSGDATIGIGSYASLVQTQTISSSKANTSYVKNARLGGTTEVKAVGVNYIIKAKQVAVPADFKDAIDNVLSEFAKPISLISVNNSTINYDKSRVICDIVTVCADIVVQSGSHLVKENAVANVPNYGTSSIGYILPCLYRNTANGTEEPGFAIIQTDGNIFPYYTKTEYNQIRINTSYSSKN